MLGLRFDMRLAPESDPVACYRAAVDMAAFGEERGAVYAAVSEHHGSPDGYLPSPAVLASAIAARTSSLPILVAAALLPFYDPVRLAEDMTVLHHLSNGRVSWVLGLGYRPEEFEMFGVERGRRGAVADEKLELLLKCLEGEPFEAGSRRIRVTPGLPAGRPSISWGGGTAAAARRAARFGLDFFAQTNIAGLENAYRKEAERRGIAPGKCVLPDPSDPMSVFVADDVDRAWDELGPYILHDAVTYAGWNVGSPMTASLSHSRTVSELRKENGAYRILSRGEAIDHIADGRPLPLHPLCGGAPPALAWRYLRTAAEASAEATRFA